MKKVEKKKEKCQKTWPSPAGIRTPDSWTKLSRPRFKFWREIKSIKFTVLKKSWLYNLPVDAGADVVTGVEADGGAGGPDSVDATFEPPSA